MATNLLLRGKVYYFRLVIPLDLRVYFNKRKELVKSLQTQDHKSAKVVLRKAQCNAERLFFMLRSGLVDKGKVVGLLKSYLVDELREWPEEKGKLYEHSYDLSDTSVEGYLSGLEKSPTERFTAVANGVRKAYFVKGKKTYIKDAARSYLEDNGMSLEGEDFKKFCDMFAQVHVYLFEELAGREEGKYSYKHEEFVNGIIKENFPDEFKPAVDEWLTSKRMSGISAGSMKLYEINASLALKFYGDEYPITKLNNKELLRYVKHEQDRGIKNVTIETRVRMIKDIVSLASTNHGITLPTFRIELKDDAADVKPFLGEELNQVFRLLNNPKLKQWQYWAVLIGLLGGLRREEVVSLRVEDVCQDGGIWYFNIVDSKTKAGIRYTPIPQNLMSLGFLDFLEQRRKSREEYLLMCWLTAPRRAYEQVNPIKYGDFFKSLRKRLTVELKHNQKKTLHSLRHNYSNSLKQARVRPDYIDELCGHEHAPGSMRSIYDEKYNLAILAESLAAATWDCDFSLLKTWKADSAGIN